MAENQELIDLFDKYVKRAPTAAEIAQFAESSNYATENYLRSLNEYNDSTEYKTRYAEIQSTAEEIFGYGMDIRQVDQWIRRGVTDSELVFQWRHSPEYQQMFVGKPVYMSEKEYRGIRDKYMTEKDTTKSDFGAYGNKIITDDDLRKIYFGGPGSEEIRKQYVEIQERKANREAQKGKLINTTVTQTALGPTQQLMRGFSSGLGSGTSNELPVTQKYASYKDYTQGIINPKYDQTTERQYDQNMLATPRP